MLLLDGCGGAVVLRFGYRDGGYQNYGISGHHELLAKRLDMDGFVHRFDEIHTTLPEPWSDEFLC